jgi:hypothetical protein
MDWKKIESLWALKLVRPEDMVQYAVEALQEGDESEIVLRLASLARYDLDLAREYFVEWLVETGRGHMTAWEAMMIYAKDVSQQIIEGKLTPYDGAKKISRMEMTLPPEDCCHDLDTFIYCEDELEDMMIASRYSFESKTSCRRMFLSLMNKVFGSDNEKRRKILEDAIVETAREIVNK